MSKCGEQVVEADQAIKAFVERRRKRRVDVSLPITVRGMDYLGKRFEERTNSINFSASGTCFLLKRRVKVGSMIELALTLPPDVKTYKTMGHVTRVEDAPEVQAYKFAVKFNRLRRS